MNMINKVILKSSLLLMCFNFNMFPLVLGTQNMGQAIALQSGKLVIVGFTIIDKAKKILVARYDANGDLDASFGASGAVVSNPGASQSANAIAIQADGKIIAAGEIAINKQSQFGLIRYNANGIPDTTFGNSGVVLTPIGNGAVINAIALQNDGKIVVAGSAVINGKPMFALARYNASNGSLDSSFGVDGIVLQQIRKRSSANALAIQPDGKIIAGGLSFQTKEGFALARFLSNGTLDSSFGISGIVTNDFGRTNIIRCMGLASDDKIVVSGQIDEVFVVGRYTSTGILDATFGNLGTTLLPQIGDESQSYGLKIQPDGKIVAVGFADETGVIFARFNTNGLLDTSFGLSGTGILTVVEVGFASARAVTLQSDNKIVATGFSCNDVSLYRLDDTNGTLDGTFGMNGIVHNPQGTFCPTQHGASGPLVKEKDQK